MRRCAACAAAPRRWPAPCAKAERPPPAEPSEVLQVDRRRPTKTTRRPARRTNTRTLRPRRWMPREEELRQRLARELRGRLGVRPSRRQRAILRRRHLHRPLLRCRWPPRRRDPARRRRKPCRRPRRGPRRPSAIAAGGPPGGGDDRPDGARGRAEGLAEGRAGPGNQPCCLGPGAGRAGITNELRSPRRRHRHTPQSARRHHHRRRPRPKGPQR